MKMFVSSLALLGFLAACEEMAMTSGMEDGMAMEESMAMEDSMAMDSSSESMSGG